MICTCHQCGADYEGSKDENAFVSKPGYSYDPTDFVCPACLKAEEEAFDTFIELLAEEERALQEIEAEMHDHWYNE